MSDTKHTPTPWALQLGKYVIPASQQDRLIGGSSNYNDHVEKYAHIIARVEFDAEWRRQVESEANAAFIVRAVNSHEKLVAALRETLAEAAGGYEHGTGESAEGLDWYQRASAALAAAEA